MRRPVPARSTASMVILIAMPMSGHRHVVAECAAAKGD
jgi:hypothetical protein